MKTDCSLSRVVVFSEQRFATKRPGGPLMFTSSTIQQTAVDNREEHCWRLDIRALLCFKYGSDFVKLAWSRPPGYGGHRPVMIRVLAQALKETLNLIELFYPIAEHCWIGYKYSLLCAVDSVP